MDNEILGKGIITFVCICVEVDLSKGLLEKIILKWKGKDYAQPFHYEKYNI